MAFSGIFSGKKAELDNDPHKQGPAPTGAGPLTSRLQTSRGYDRIKPEKQAARPWSGTPRTAPARRKGGGTQS